MQVEMKRGGVWTDPWDQWQVIDYAEIRDRGCGSLRKVGLQLDDYCL